MLNNAEFFATNPGATILDLIAYQQEQNELRYAARMAEIAERHAARVADIDRRYQQPARHLTVVPAPVAVAERQPCLVGDTECCDFHAQRAYGRNARRYSWAADDDLVDFDTWR